MTSCYCLWLTLTQLVWDHCKTYALFQIFVVYTLTLFLYCSLSSCNQKRLLVWTIYDEGWRQIIRIVSFAYSHFSYISPSPRLFIICRLCGAIWLSCIFKMITFLHLFLAVCCSACLAILSTAKFGDPDSCVEKLPVGWEGQHNPHEDRKEDEEVVVGSEKGPCVWNVSRWEAPGENCNAN